jgi:ribonuclease HII
MAMKTVIGVDEVGRGPLAGPVTVCIVCCEEEIYQILKKERNLPKKGMDSKKLTREEREKYANFLDKLKNLGKISYAITHVSNKLIDSHGLSFCIKKAIEENFKKLDINDISCQILLDGSLKAPVKFKNQRTIIKGDEKEKIIAWASILAKVERDSLMREMAKKFPQYGFDMNKGYGTLFHQKKLLEHGLSAIHRKSFIEY